MWRLNSSSGSDYSALLLAAMSSSRSDVVTKFVSPSVTFFYGVFGVFCQEGVWKVSGRCLEGVREVSGMCKF